jgi:arsenite oxidase small subunit
MFDPAKAGQCYQGLASTPLPQIRLRVAQNGDILAQGVVGLIWGRARNI